MKLCDKIKNRRESLGMRQKDLASVSGLTPAAISMIERGDRIPNIKSFAAICKALSITMDSLYYLDAPMPCFKDFKKSMERLQEDIDRRMEQFKGKFITSACSGPEKAPGH